MRKTLKEFESSFVKNVETFNTIQKEKFDQMKLKQDEMIKTTEIRLERMRETVDEKLHKTLEERLGKSFEMVTKQLLVVQKGLGEMQNTSYFTKITPPKSFAKFLKLFRIVRKKEKSG